MATKYYQAENVTRQIAGIWFQKTRIICGCAWGCAAVDDPETQLALDAMEDQGLNGVLELTEDQYWAQVGQKKTNSVQPIDSGAPFQGNPMGLPLVQPAQPIGKVPQVIDPEIATDQPAISSEMPRLKIDHVPDPVIPRGRKR